MNLMFNKLSPISSFALAVATFCAGLTGEAAQVDLKEAASADSMLFLSIEDFPGYLNVYPEAALEGAMLVQTTSVAGSPLQLQSFIAVTQKFWSLSKEFTGQVVLSGRVEGERPLLQLLADCSADAESLEAVFADAKDFGPAEKGETIGGYSFSSRTVSEDISLFYAIANGRLIVTTDMDLARRAVDSINGKGEGTPISSSPAYQKALSFAKDYDGALGLFQLTDAFWNLVEPKFGEAGAVVDALGARNIEGMFFAYPKGARVLKESLGGVLVKEGASSVDLYEKPAGDLQLPAWAAADSYLNFSMQLDLPHLKDGILSLMETLTPGSSASYQQANQMAAMMIGVTIDDLLGKGLGDQISVSMDMDMSVMSNLVQTQGKGAAASPMKGMLLNLKVKDRQILEGLVTAVLAQAQGMVQRTDYAGATFLSAPSMMPGLAPGSSMNLALTDSDLFIQMGQIDALKEILKRAGGEVTGAFANAPMKRIFEPLHADAISVMTVNYAGFFVMMKSLYLNGDQERTEAEKEKVQAYFDFLEQMMDEVAVVTTQSEGAYLFSMGMGK